MNPLLFLAIAVVVPLLGMLVLGAGARLQRGRETDDETELFRRKLQAIAPRETSVRLIERECSLPALPLLSVEKDDRVSSKPQAGAASSVRRVTGARAAQPSPSAAPPGVTPSSAASPRTTQAVSPEHPSHAPPPELEPGLRGPDLDTSRSASRSFAQLARQSHTGRACPAEPVSERSPSHGTAAHNQRNRSGA